MESSRYEVLLWFIGRRIMQPAGQAIFNGVLLRLQLCLGLWQIAKLTPLWALISCSMSWLMVKLFPDFCFARSNYRRLQNFEGRVFKRVICHVTTAGDLPTVRRKKANDKFENHIQVSYLGRDFNLERKDGNTLLMDNLAKYYITEEMWRSVVYIKEVAPNTVFIRNYREIWEEVVSGGVMSLEEVLDSVILDNRTVTRLDHDYFLPIDLSVSEEKILKVFNLVGLFLQTQKHIHWLIPALLSLTSAVMGFSTELRRYVFEKNNMFCCCVIHLLCQKLPFQWRRQVYSLGNWIENLKPSNDLQSKIHRRNICAIIAGGAKVHIHAPSASLCDSATSIDIDSLFKQEYEEPHKSFNCGTFDIDCRFKKNDGKCSLKAGDIASIDIDCNREQAEKLFEFAAHMAESQSGSLKCYDANKKTVYVRRFRESVVAYARSRYPPLYQLELGIVSVG